MRRKLHHLRGISARMKCRSLSLPAAYEVEETLSNDDDDTTSSTIQSPGCKLWRVTSSEDDDDDATSIILEESRDDEVQQVQPVPKLFTDYEMIQAAYNKYVATTQEALCSSLCNQAVFSTTATTTSTTSPTTTELNCPTTTTTTSCPSPQTHSVLRKPTIVRFAPTKRVQYFTQPHCDHSTMYYTEEELQAMADECTLQVTFCETETVVYFQVHEGHKHDLYYSDMDIRSMVDDYELECMLQGDEWEMCEYEALQLA